MSKAISESERIDLNPMMDAIFIMLIFFIVTASFVKETGVSIQRSVSNNEPLTSQRAATIKLSQTDLMINGQSLEVGGLKSRLMQLRSENPGLKVQLVANKSVAVERLVKTMEQITLAGVEGVAVAAFE